MCKKWQSTKRGFGFITLDTFQMISFLVKTARQAFFTLQLLPLIIIIIMKIIDQCWKKMLLLVHTYYVLFTTRIFCVKRNKNGETFSSIIIFISNSLSLRAWIIQNFSKNIQQIKQTKNIFRWFRCVFHILLFPCWFGSVCFTTFLMFVSLCQSQHKLQQQQSKCRDDVEMSDTSRLTLSVGIG